MLESDIESAIREDVLELKAHLRSLARSLTRLADRMDTMGDRVPSNGILASSSTPATIDRLAITIAAHRRVLGL